MRIVLTVLVAAGLLTVGESHLRHPPGRNPAIPARRPATDPRLGVDHTVGYSTRLPVRLAAAVPVGGRGTGAALPV